MVNQICIAGLLQGLSEGLAFAQKAGLDGEAVLDVIAKGAAGSWQMENRGRTMLDDKFDFGFAVDWMRKDLGICLAEAERQRRRAAGDRADRPVLQGRAGHGRRPLGHLEPDPPAALNGSISSGQGDLALPAPTRRFPSTNNRPVLLAERSCCFAPSANLPRPRWCRATSRSATMRPKSTSCSGRPAPLPGSRRGVSSLRGAIQGTRTPPLALVPRKFQGNSPARLPRRVASETLVCGATMPDREIQPSDLVSHFFDTSIGPERLDQLIRAWDTQIDSTCPDRLTPIAAFADRSSRTASPACSAILEQVQENERRQLDELLAHLHTAAMVVKHDGRVLAANAEAGAAFGTRRTARLPSCRSMRPSSPRSQTDCPRSRPVPKTGKTCSGSGPKIPTGSSWFTSRRFRALEDGAACWPSPARSPGTTTFRTCSAGLRPDSAEIEVLRHLVSGATVAAIARAGGRTQGTVRSQLHAILEKTATRSQAEVVRLAVLLLSRAGSTWSRAGPPVAEPHQRFLRLDDGRRLELLCSATRGAGRSSGCSRRTALPLPAPAEVSLADRGLRVVVPMRAGYCGSDPAPDQAYSLDLAVADMVAVMDQLDIVSRPWSPARRHPDRVDARPGGPARVRHIFGIGAGFPILDDRQYRRLIPVARFVRACARHGPSVLPFLIRGVQP